MANKTVGKKAEPTIEELEFIHTCFQRGLSDAEVLYEMQDTEFPVRTKGFMKRRRREFNAVKKVLTDCTVSSKTEQDPVLTRAREQHLDEIHDLIDEWREAVSIPGWLDEISKISLPIHKVESNPLFVCLMEHLPLPSLWQEYSVWGTRFAEYKRNYDALFQEIYEWGKSHLHLDSHAKEHHAHDLANLLITDLAERMQMGLHKAEPDAVPEHVPHWWKKDYPQLRSEVLDSETVSKLKTLYEEFSEIQDRIHESLTEIHLGHDHIMHTCHLCPGQTPLLP